MRPESPDAMSASHGEGKTSGAARTVSTFLAGAVLAAGAAFAGEWRASGPLGVESRGFTGDPEDPAQVEDLQGSLVLRPEFRFRSGGGRHQMMVSPFLRLDGADEERTHADLRQGFYRYVGDAWEILAGADRVFWGVTESRHLVDVINQVDAVEDVDEEDRLGQPMISATFLPRWGTLSVYALTGFRERTYPGRDGRLRTPLVVETSDPVYESDAGRSRIDLALRYAQAAGDWDVGFHAFSGTSREPRLVADPAGRSLIPHYDLMNQAGVDLQYTRSAWLWKLEALVRETRLDDFTAFVGGAEYTLYQVGGSAIDVGLLAEYLHDGRHELRSPPTIFDDDIFLGTRLAFNDVQDSDLLAGVVIDRSLGSRAISVEAGRRVGTSWSVELEARFFTAVDDEDVMAILRSDDFVTLRLSWNL